MLYLHYRGVTVEAADKVKLAAAPMEALQAECAALAAAAKVRHPGRVSACFPNCVFLTNIMLLFPPALVTRPCVQPAIRHWLGLLFSAQASAAELNAAQAELGEIRPILIAHAKCHTESVQLHTKVCARTAS